MSTCGITNLGSCLVENLFEFLAYLMNLPIRPLLIMINNLIIESVNIEVFSGTWSVIVYILSLFYGILLLITGFRFIISGQSVQEQEKSKKSLANIILMMVLIQISFFLYGLILDVISSMTSTIYSMIDEGFFLMTVDNISNIGLELIMLMPYVMTLVMTLIFLSLRYICVGVGIIFFTFGIFFYFIEPLKEYGKLILNYTFTLMILPFFYSIIFLASSKFLDLDIFGEMKILVMIGGFSLANLMTCIVILFIVFKAANAISKPIGDVKKIAGTFI